MIKGIIDIDIYWKVIVYYDIDYDFFNIIVDDLINHNISNNNIDRIYNNMFSHKAKACTVSIPKCNTSIVLFNKHKSYYDYINSIVHEAEHIKQTMLYTYQIDDLDEPPAYTVGYVASQMIKLLNLTIN